jgi:hypothetical protein
MIEAMLPLVLHYFPAGQERVAHYTNLRPGRYHFEVRAANEDAVRGKENSILEFEVRPYFWLTYWFYGLCATVLLLASVSTYQWRICALRPHWADLGGGQNAGTPRLPRGRCRHHGRGLCGKNSGPNTAGG